ncbi:MAG: mechanosensitive ion channel [Marinibacterium sp.]|nr:mechanosensitive ion channel [Marinibacterium sp.]
MHRRFLALILLVLGLAFAGTTGFAQALPGTGTSSSGDAAAEPAPDLSSPEAINAAVARLSDDEVRALLLDQLNATATDTADAEAPKNLIERVSATWVALTTPTIEAFRALPILLVKQAEAFANFGASFGGTGGVLTLFGLLAVAVGAGLVLEFIVRKMLARWRKLDDVIDTSTLWGALNFLFRRFGREIVGLFVFYFTVRTVGRTILTPEQMAFAGLFATYLIWFPRVTAALSRFLLAPARPEMRLVNVPDGWARYLHYNIIGVVLLASFTQFIIQFNASNGVPAGTTRLGYWLSALFFFYIGLIAWRARDGLSSMMRGTDPDNSRFDEQVAQAYPYFAMGLSFVLWLVVQYVVGSGQIALILSGPQYTTLIWLLMAPALDTAIRGLVRHLVPPMKGEGVLAEEAYRSTKRSYIRIGRVLVVGVVIMIIANAWQLDLFSAEGDLPGIGDNIVAFLLTAAVGYVVYEGVSLWINRRLAAEHTSREVTEDEAGGEGGGGSGSRLGTVLPLARVTAQSAIVVIFGLLAIGNLGIDITPLLAGAGILGLAIGFGAQKLVSDVVSGVFFLIDDAFRVGEYVEIGATRGAVEKISIRSMQLRHHRGPVHTIPYGEIPQLTNYSRDWVIMKLRFTVPFDTDPNKVKKIFKKIGAEMSADELFKDDFLEPFKSQGVFEFDDVGIVIRGKFMAKPGKQFTIRKEIYNRVKREFDEAGIDFARREVRVAIPNLHDEDDVSDAEKAAISAAAAEAVQQEIREQEKPQG